MPEKKRPLNYLVVVLAKRNQQDQALFLDCNSSTQACRRYAPRWLSISSYPTRARGIIGN